MKIALRFKLASSRDPFWWIEKEELRFYQLMAVNWVKLIGEPAGTVSFILGPFNLKIFFAWRKPVSTAQEVKL